MKAATQEKTGKPPLSVDQDCQFWEMQLPVLSVQQYPTSSFTRST
jgi:hypothetical protein